MRILSSVEVMRQIMCVCVCVCVRARACARAHAETGIETNPVWPDSRV